MSFPSLHGIAGCARFGILAAIVLVLLIAMAARGGSGTREGTTPIVHETRD